MMEGGGKLIILGGGGPPPVGGGMDVVGVELPVINCGKPGGGPEKVETMVGGGTAA